MIDGRRWNAYAPRTGDIVIATFPKCGTTWTQRIVDLLVFQNTDPRPVSTTSVWLDSRIFTSLAEDVETLQAQQHRRFIKSHLPFDGLPIYEGVNYIHVARNGRDAFMSWHNHVLGFTPEGLRRIGAVAAADPDLPSAPAAAAPPTDPHLFFQGWIAQAEAEAGVGPGQDLGFFDFENTYWIERRRDNLLMVHYNDLKADLCGEMRRISEFLDINTPDQRLRGLADAAGFDNMKAQGNILVSSFEEMFDRGADRFLNKGTNDRWKGALTKDDLERYDAAARRKLSPACADWVAHGLLVAGDPRALAD